MLVRVQQKTISKGARFTKKSVTVLRQSKATADSN